MLTYNFDSVLKFYKQLKTPLTTIVNQSPNIILGTYEDLVVLRVLECAQPGPFLSPGMWLNLKLKCDDDLKGNYPSEFIPNINGQIEEGQMYIDINRELNIKYYRVLDDISKYNHSYNGIFSDGEFFDNFNNMKATDGAILFRLAPRICFFVYKGLVPYLKSDTVYYDIYCGENDFIVKFTTVKKKHDEPKLYTYVRYLYL